MAGTGVIPMARGAPGQTASGHTALRPLIVLLALALVVGVRAGAAFGQDRREDLEGLREKIQDSRERVIAHEADERALLERLEEMDKRLRAVTAERDAARRAGEAARRRLATIEPKLAAARAKLAGTQRALAARADALYRGGEIGPLRVLFSADGLPEMLARANALRLLVRHDAELVARLGEERDVLEALRAESAEAVEERRRARAELERAAAALATEQRSKRAILARVRQDRSSERQLLLELEQAAQALEETIRTLGATSRPRDAVSPDSGFARRRGGLQPPVDAPVSGRFGRVVDPEFGTSTFRSGLKFAAPPGTPVRSVAGGLVRFAGWFRGYGRIVIVDHGDGFHTVSAHLAEILVGIDDVVVEGQTLGTVGETGSLSGPSLYFELRREGRPLDPQSWLSAARG
jgi:septal ring factor EnvC (AmiA/AmiB activator)